MNDGEVRQPRQNQAFKSLICSRFYRIRSYVRERYPGIVSPDRAAVVGYSGGGGGNALACAVKFPDTFTDIIDHFGISDYGIDDEYGWYGQNAAYRDIMERWIGGTPETVPDSYYARAHLYGLPNYG